MLITHHPGYSTETAAALLPTEPPNEMYVPGSDNIAFVARPVVEYLHQNPMDAIVAADRGGRLLALAIHGCWKHHYPGEHFPTIDGKIHFVRNSTSLDLDISLHAIDLTLDRALQSSQKSVQEQSIMFMDDWIMGGATIHRFALAAAKRGLLYKNIHVATMSGNRLPKRRTSNNRTSQEQITHHIVAQPYWSGSRWCDDDDVIGIDFQDDGITPIAKRGPERLPAQRARIKMHKHIAEFYKPYTEALATKRKVRDTVTRQKLKDEKVKNTLLRILMRDR
jgi:hypothetical protein